MAGMPNPVITLCERIDEAGDLMVAARDAYLDRVKDVVLDAVGGYPVTVYLFGSRARGDIRRTSDVDVAVEPHGPLPASLLANLRDALDESTIPYRVDIVDLSAADRAFRERVRKEGIVWKDCANESTSR